MSVTQERTVASKAEIVERAKEQFDRILPAAGKDDGSMLYSVVHDKKSGRVSVQKGETDVEAVDILTEFYSSEVHLITHYQSVYDGYVEDIKINVGKMFRRD